MASMINNTADGIDKMMTRVENCESRSMFRSVLKYFFIYLSVNKINKVLDYICQYCNIQ